MACRPALACGHCVDGIGHMAFVEAQQLLPEGRAARSRQNRAYRTFCDGRIFCLRSDARFVLRTAAQGDIRSYCRIDFGLRCLLDEFHQLFTPGRSGGDVGDWIADTFGAFCGVLLMGWIVRKNRFDRSRYEPKEALGKQRSRARER